MSFIPQLVGIKKEGSHSLLGPLNLADASGLVLRRLISWVDPHKFSAHRWMTESSAGLLHVDPGFLGVAALNPRFYVVSLWARSS